ncbi:MAG: hypothetical protein AAGK21_14110 [Bacteroidota bacterium]
MTPPSCPDDFALQYRWREGSLPPPGHYAIHVQIDASGAGLAVLTQGYGREGPTWTERFELSPAERAAVHQALLRHGLDARWREPERHRVGGATWSLEVTASGSVHRVSSGEEADGFAASVLRDAVRDAVPDAVWSTLRQQRTAYLADAT